MPSKRPLPFIRLLLAVLTLAWGTCHAQTSPEPQIKAAFLVNFLKYVEWPEAKPTATICLFGHDALETYLTRVEGRPVAGRELRLRRVTHPNQTADCDVLYIPEHEEARFGIVLRWVDRQATLTVSDAEIFTRYGGAIALVRADGRLQFDINAQALQRAGLKPSSQLMKLARNAKDTR
ncbi:hypothetical protein GCM10027343_30810 [Noviherbaspirillum agri]